MTGLTPPPFGSGAGDEPLRTLEGGLMAAQRRAFGDPERQAAFELEQAADLNRLASQQAETEQLLERLEAEGLIIAFTLGTQGGGLGVTVRDGHGYTVRELKPSDMTNLARLRELVQMP